MGLGNPEPGYRRSPHNAGFECIACLDERLEMSESVELGNVTARRGRYRDHSVVLARPLTWMNASGEGVLRLLDHLDADISDMVVITDDMDLPLGQIRVRAGGGAGTHRGMQSVVSRLGSTGFPRIRIGIRPSRRDPADLVAYVLTPLAGEEDAALGAGIKRAADAAIAILDLDITRAMNLFNRKSHREEDVPGENILFAPPGGCRIRNGSGAATAATIQKESLCIDRTKSGSL